MVMVMMVHKLDANTGQMRPLKPDGCSVAFLEAVYISDLTLSIMVDCALEGCALLLKLNLSSVLLLNHSNYF